LGYYNSLDGKQSATLKTELHNIICEDTTHYLIYGPGINHTWQGFYSTDRDENTNLVVDMYSSVLRYFPVDYIVLGYKGFGTAIHIEHSVPKSWWGCDINHPDCAAEDLNHLYPSDGSTNSSKNDNPLGVVSGIPTKDNGVSKIGPAVYSGYVGNVFEPANEFKGDFARSYFYMATAYEHYVNKWDTSKPENMMENNTYPTLKPWAIQLLLEWNRQDPVSEKELTRVEKVFNIQLNRNPYIDHPELIEYVWGNKMGVNWNSTNNNENHYSNKKLTILANPTKGCINFIFENNSGLCRYSIYALNGRVVRTDEISDENVSVTNLASGAYLLVVEAKGNLAVRKLITVY